MGGGKTTKVIQVRVGKHRYSSSGGTETKSTQGSVLKAWWGSRGGPKCPRKRGEGGG